MKRRCSLRSWSEPEPLYRSSSTHDENAIMHRSRSINDGRAMKVTLECITCGQDQRANSDCVHSKPVCPVIAQGGRGDASTIVEIHVHVRIA